MNPGMRKAGLHPEQARHQVEEEVAQEGSNDQAQERGAQSVRQGAAGKGAVSAGAQGAAHGDLVPEDEPQHDARVGLRGVLEPGGPCVQRHRLRRRHVVR